VQTLIYLLDVADNNAAHKLNPSKDVSQCFDAVGWAAGRASGL